MNTFNILGFDKSHRIILVYLNKDVVNPVMFQKLKILSADETIYNKKFWQTYFTKLTQNCSKQTLTKLCQSAFCDFDNLVDSLTDECLQSPSRSLDWLTCSKDLDIVSINGTDYVFQIQDYLHKIDVTELDINLNPNLTNAICNFANKLYLSTQNDSEYISLCLEYTSLCQQLNNIDLIKQLKQYIG